MRIPWQSSLVVFIMLLGCTSPTTTQLSGGGNDFPNATVVGKAIADNLSQGDHWADSLALPAASSPAPIARSAVLPSVPSEQTAKRAVKSQSLHIAVDSVAGIVLMDYSAISDSILRRDTLIFLYDSAFRDNVKDNEHLYLVKSSSIDLATLARTSSLFVDADGDNVINNKNGRLNRVIVSSSTSFLLRPARTSQIVVDAGADQDLATGGDNRIMLCRTFDVNASGDTVSLTQYESYGADSVILDASSRDSSFIRARMIDTDILGRKTLSQAVFLVFPADSVKNRPVYFQSVKTLLTGAAVKLLVRSQKPDSLFFTGDTAWAYLITEAPGDSGNIDTICMRVLVGENPANPDANRLIGLSRHLIKRRASDRETIFSLTSDVPLAKGETLRSGSFSLKIVGSDDQWYLAKGAFSPEGISAAYEDSKGKSVTLKWDRMGLPVN
jgi:hypothetical protein